MKLPYVLVGASVLIFAMPALAETPSKDPGASGYSPGDQMHDKGSLKGDPGASGYAPGHEMQEHRSLKGDPGASGYSPGDQAKDKNSDKSSSGSAPGTKEEY